MGLIKVLVPFYLLIGLISYLPMLGAKAGVRDGIGLIKGLVPLFREKVGLRPPRIEVVALLESFSAFLLKIGHRIIASTKLGVLF